MEGRVREQLLDARRVLEGRLSEPGLTGQQRSDAYGEAGMLHHAYDLRETAQACYRNAQQLAPQDHRWPYYLAHLYRAEGRSERSTESFRRVLELRPESVPALVHLGQAKLEQNRHDLAEPLFRRAFQAESGCAPALIGLGKIAAARGDHSEAVQRFEAAVQADPRATEVNYLLAIAYRDLGQRDKASTFMDRRGPGRANVDDPLMTQLKSLANDWPILQNRGVALYQTERYEEALAEFRKAAETAPEEPMVRINLGSTLTNLGDLDGAAREFREALRIDPENALAHFNLGTILARFGDDPSAIEHYRIALRHDPDYLNVHFNLANALRRTGSYGEASRHYRRVVEGDPRRSPARHAEALALIRLHRYREAAERLEEAAEAMPEYRPFRHALVRLLAASPPDDVRDGERALALGQALVNEESSLAHVVALAMAAAETGDFQFALEWQARAIEVATAAGRTDLLADLRENHDRYRRREPCRIPWKDDDPILSPGGRDRSAPRKSRSGKRGMSRSNGGQPHR
jgi:tetratricopeptide (TPR) repeat protein